MQGITRTADQRRQLIKRMEPLTEENEKLKEVMKLMEKNIQRAQRERDLAESNARDLEYRKGVLSEKLATTSEQLATGSEQLTSTFEQLERKIEQLKSFSVQKAGMAYRRMRFVVLNNHIVADDCCTCRARFKAWPATPNRRATLRGGGEGVSARGEAGRGAKR